MKKDKRPQTAANARSRRLLIMGAVALLLAGSVVWLTLSNRRTPQRKAIFSADSLAIAAIEVADKDGMLRFERAGTVWNITKPLRWGVEEGRFKLFLEEVIHARYDATPLASGSEGLKQFNLAKDAALKVKAFDAKGKLLAEVWFSDLGNPNDYFRYAGESKVFRIDTKAANYYAPRFDTWRSPYVLTLAWDQLQSLSVRHPRNRYDLTRKGELWHYRDAIEEFEIKPGNQTMGKILNALAQLGSYTMLTDDEKPDPDSLRAPEVEVLIRQTDGKELTIKFFPYRDKNYLMTVSSHPDYYFVVLFDTVFRFSRHAELFRAKVGEVPGV